VQPMEEAWPAIRDAKRIVIKIGTKSLLLDDRSFDFKTMATLIQDIKQMIKDQGKEVVLVTSGAVSAGMKKLGIEERPRDLVLQQVAAGVGNPLLLNEYVRMFDDVPVAQVLLTQEDLSNRISYNHFLDAMERMLQMGVVPIVNENDVVSIDELVGTKSGESMIDYNFSDNDVLSALVAASINADLLVVMSDVDGLYTKPPTEDGAEFIPYVDELTDEIKVLGLGGSNLGRGGMVTKLKAAQICMQSGVWMIITNAKKAEVIDLVASGGKCTIFKPAERLPGKKLWIIFAANVQGKISLDDGAVEAIRSGASLLLPGITSVQGEFHENDVVEIWDSTDLCLGRGMTNYSAQEIERFLTLYHQDKKLFRSQNVEEIVHTEKMALFV